MSEFGNYLRSARENANLSLADVQQQTGITNSRLSRTENNEECKLSPAEIKQLANLYNVPVVLLFMKAGWLDTSDLEEYRSGFKNVALLEKDEKKHIQDQIDFIVKKKEGRLE